VRRKALDVGAGAWLDDLPLLVDTFIKELSATHKKPISRITPDAMQLFYKYPWPGNVRELRNAIESMIVLTKDDVLDGDDVPNYITTPRATGDSRPGEAGETGVHLETAEKEFARWRFRERQLLDTIRDLDEAFSFS